MSADPLDPPIILRSNGDFLKAQDASRQMLKLAFGKIDAGSPLNEADKTNLLRGARLCAAMSAYLPGQAEGQDFKCGEALAALGYHEEAIHRYKLFLDALGPNPITHDASVERADALALIGVSLTALNDTKGALDSINEAIKAYPDAPTYHNDRAAVEIKLGRPADAKKDYERALLGDPNDPAHLKAEMALKTLKLN